MKEAREFPLGDVLSITTGILLTNFTDMKNCMEFLLQSDDLATIGVAMMKHKATTQILEQHPQLKVIKVDKVTAKNYEKWLAKQEKEYGRTLSIKPVQNGEKG